MLQKDRGLVPRRCVLRTVNMDSKCITIFIVLVYAVWAIVRVRRMTLLEHSLSAASVAEICCQWSKAA